MSDVGLSSSSPIIRMSLQAWTFETSSQRRAARLKIDQLAVSVSRDYLGQRFLRGAGRHMRVVV